MRIALIAKPGHANTGVGRYVIELERELQAHGHQIALVHPIVPCPAWVVRAVRRWLGWDLEAFFHNYPVWARYPKADIYHITSQNLATLMLLRRPPGKTVITVHDIIPWITRHDAELCVYMHKFEAFFDQFTLWGLKKADRLLADSSFTAQNVTDTIKVSPVDVTTVMLGIR